MREWHVPAAGRAAGRQAGKLIGRLLTVIATDKYTDLFIGYGKPGFEAIVKAFKTLSPGSCQTAVVLHARGADSGF